MTGSDRTDWAEIRRLYVAGALSLARIAERHGISVQRIARRARRDGWPPRPRPTPGAREGPPPKSGAKKTAAAAGRQRAPPRSPQPAAERGTDPSTATSLKARRALVRRLYKAIDTKLKQMERRMAHDIAAQDGTSDTTAADHERDTRAIGALIANLNHGVGTAARILQEALGVEIDGEIGPITLGAARIAEPRQALARYAAIRRQRYRALPHFWRFGRGWLRRVDATLAAAIRLVPPTSDPVSTEENPHMTGPTDAPTTKPYATSEIKGWWQSMTIWGTLLTAITTVLPLMGVVLGFSITPELAEQIGQDIVLVIQAIGGLIGTLMALFGGARATTLFQARSRRTGT